ncbi:MAG: response regulator [Betaproteobacteria bacterium]
MVAMAQTVFMVDDDASIRTAVRRLLKSSGFSVSVFSSAEAFWQSDFKTTSGCLILDIRLPGMNGYELLELFLASGVYLPTIVITGHDRAGMEERAMQLGASSYLRKPFDEETLLGAINSAMNHYRVAI